ncbi:hypothetical protein HK407_08g12640 [Ordospora pajunii]|uniref:uncharacterized protein n=1 Tax=Ordospora pajunii TaxID=3039483 RepID=UPI002952855C|nr:uncharacterized protein HK407_08g12640 [Ordospora pajunii]KAH9411120.1 hypothetical protein HK407_08g12640 [Ordospora pajunii]
MMHAALVHGVYGVVHEEYTEMMRPLGYNDILRLVDSRIELGSKSTQKKVMFYIKSIYKQRYGKESITAIISSGSDEPQFLGYTDGKKKGIVVQNQAFEWSLKRVEGTNGYNITPEWAEDECMTLSDEEILSISTCRIQYSRQVFVFEDEPYPISHRKKNTRSANEIHDGYHSDSSSDLNYYIGSVSDSSRYAEDDSSHAPAKLARISDSSDSDAIKELLEPSVVRVASDPPKPVSSTTYSSITTYGNSMVSPVPVTVLTSVLTSTSVSTVLVHVTKTVDDEQTITIINEPTKNRKKSRCMNKGILPSIISASDVCNENESNSSSESFNESNYYQNDLKYYNSFADMRIQDIKSLNDVKSFSLNEFPVLKKFISLYETDSNAQIQSTVTSPYTLSITTVA